MFETVREHKAVIRMAGELAALMLSKKESWEEHARRVAAHYPHLFPGMLVHIRLAIDHLKIADETRILLIDMLGSFRDSLVASKGAEWEKRRVAAIYWMFAAQRNPPVRSAKEFAELLSQHANDPLEAAVITLDIWNVMTREGWHMDALGVLNKVIRGAIKRKGLA
jgi:hypothetical protein